MRHSETRKRATKRPCIFIEAGEAEQMGPSVSCALIYSTFYLHSSKTLKIATRKSKHTLMCVNENVLVLLAKSGQFPSGLSLNKMY